MVQRTRPLLDRKRLIAAAFEQLEEDGLERLSMRRVAARLGVQAPALYWHFGDKAELLGLMARDIYAAGYAGVPSAADWRSWLIQFGHALRRSFGAHRDGASLCARVRPPPSSDPTSYGERLAAPLVALGLDPNRALSFQSSVISYTLGWAAFEANGPMHEFLERMLAFEDSYSAGLHALVRGFPVDGPPMPGSD